MPEFLRQWLDQIGTNLGPLVILGLIGQAVFMCRFLVQWIASERAGRSVMPTAFWWLSLAGAGLLLSYAILKADPVFILGQSLGFMIYVRNLVLIHRNNDKDHALGG